MPAQLEAPQAQAAARPAPAISKTEAAADPLSGQAASPESDSAPNYAHLANIPLRLEAILGQLTMTMRAVTSLEVGSVLALNRSAGDNVDLCVAGVNLASGEIVVIDGALSVRITDLLTGER